MVLFFFKKKKYKQEEKKLDRLRFKIYEQNKKRKNKNMKKKTFMANQ